MIKISDLTSNLRRQSFQYTENNMYELYYFLTGKSSEITSNEFLSREREISIIAWKINSRLKCPKTRARTYEISSGVSLSLRVHNPTKKRKQSILNIPRQEKAYAC